MHAAPASPAGAVSLEGREIDAMGNEQKNTDLPQSAIDRPIPLGRRLVDKLSFPQRLPEWVRKEAAATRYVDGDHLVEILDAPDLLWVWESIGRGKRLNNKDRYWTTLRIVGNAVANGLRTLEWYETITGAERRKRSNRISALADELCQESELIVGSADGIFPNGLMMRNGMFSYYSLDMTYDFIRDSHLIDAEDSEKSRFVASLSESDKGTLTDIIRDAFWYAAKRTPELLGVIANGIEEWGETAPALYRPNDANAQRLLFIRRITDAFVGAFGRPFREESLALTGHYFDISDLDAATLSRLAPVSKTRKARLHTTESNSGDE